MHWFCALTASIFVCLTALVGPSWGAPAAHYDLTDLGEVFNVFALDKGSDTVTAARLENGLQRAVIFGALAQALGLPPPEGFPQLLGLDHGRVCGLYNSPNGFVHAFVFSQADGFVDPGTLNDDGLYAQCNDLNSVDLVGVAERPDAVQGNTVFVPVIFLGGGPPVELPTIGHPGPGAFPILGSALAVNDAGDIAGDSQTDTGETRATLWAATSRTRPRNLGTLGGSFSLALDLNTERRVAGFSTDTFGRSQAFVWTHQRGIELLPPLPGDVAGVARSVNDAGDIVGQSIPEDPLPAVGVLWDRQRHPIRLQDRVIDAQGITLAGAVGINNLGTIAALGFQGTALHAVLLTPVDEHQKRRRPHEEAQAFLHEGR